MAGIKPQICQVAKTSQLFNILCIFIREMNNPEFKYKGLSSKWLLAVVLLLSFFTFSGIAIQSQAKQNPSRTEVAYTTQSQAAKCITYCRAQQQTKSGQNALLIFAASAIDLAYFSSLQVKILSITYSSKSIYKPQGDFFYQHKLIPQNNSDEPITA